MLAVDETSTHVRVACNACGAERIFRRFTSRPTLGGIRHEPEEGRWIQCRVCGDWSPFERPVSTDSALATH
jgi:hypothetical protein